jgi:glycosyltransferase involved in cell wall biosynthesis
MRIAVFCPHYEDAGGVQEVVRRLTLGMASRGHTLHLVARLPGGTVSALPARDPSTGAVVSRVRFVRAPHRRAGGRAYRHFLHRFPASALRLVRELRRVRPDLVATHCSKFHAPYVLALRGALGVPLVVHLHNGPQTADGPESLLLSRLLLRCAERVIAVSTAIADYARGVLPARAARVIVVPNGADQDEFAEVPPAARARSYVLGAGALAERKGFDLLIDAFADAGIDLDLVLAGDGPERAALEARAAARGVASRVQFLGHVARAIVASLLRGAAMVAMPSRFEGHPLIALEAMLAGAPLIASDIPGLPPELRNGETGLLVPPEDVAALAHALRELSESRERARGLGRAAREAARRFPSWDEVTARVLAEYATAVG